MKVLVLTPHLYNTAPGARFRIEQWAHYLKPDGFQFTFAPFEDAALHLVLYQEGQIAHKVRSIRSAFGRRLQLIRTVKNFDLVYLYREAAILGPAFIERLIARQGVPIIYDFDDPIWLSYSSPTNRAFSKLKWQTKVPEICKLASTVVVGNRLLAEWAFQHSRHVEIIPSTIDFEHYPPKPYRSDVGQTDNLVLGWTGSHSTLPFLESIQPALKKLAEQRRFELLVISHTDSFTMDVGQAEVRSQKWNAQTEALDLHSMDIGLAPFPDSGWTPWRCHGKVLQYMAVGLPAVASNIGILPDYISDGENGMLVSSQDEWVEKIIQLMDCADMRRQLGLAARQTIQEHYSAGVWVPKLRRVLDAGVAQTI